MRIAVDAMGGDYAPGAVIEGLVSALSDFPTYEYALVGDLEKVGFYLEKYGIAGDPRIHQVNANSVCEMAEPSSVSLRAKKDSTITVCAKLLKSREVDAMVTPGHTGATVAATKVLVRTLPGIDRPGLVASIPTQRSRFLPMIANCARFRGVLSGFAPASISRKRLRWLGILATRPGRSIPGKVLTRTLVAATVAPVCPGVTMASTSRLLSNFAQTVIDESFFARNDTDDGSAISQTLFALT